MTLVIDASAAAEILLGTQQGRAATRLLAAHHLVAPEHFAVEVASVIRGWSLSGQIAEERAMVAFTDLEMMGVQHLPVFPLLPAAFQLRHNVSMYDALYVVLARTLGSKLLTLDSRLASAAPDCAVGPIR